MSDASFRGDCGRCAALCCVLLSFDRGPHFAFGKAAGVACRHLDRGHRCAIHDRLDASGMSGCARFDCRGAGQVVTAMFRGQDWRRHAPTRRAIATAFLLMREVQSLRLLLLNSAAGAGSGLASRLEAATTSYPALLALDLGAARSELGAILGRSSRVTEP